MTYPAVSKYVLIGKETTWGTKVPATKDVGLIISDVTNTITREVIQSLGISSITAQKITTGITDPEVTISGDFQHGRLLELIFGNVSHVSAAPETTHTFLTDDNVTSLTIEVGNDLTTDTVLQTNGCIAESAELSIALNENLKLSTTFKGKNVSSTTSASSAVLSTLAVFPHALCGVALAGVTASEIQSASINIAKTIERSGGVGSNEYQQGHPTEMKFDFSANLGFTDNAFHKLFMVGVNAAGDAVTAITTADPTGTDFVIHAGNDLAAGAGGRQVHLALKSCQYNNFTETTSVGGLTFIDVSGSGLIDSCFSIDDISTASW